jgi:hypothetical protein
MRKFLALLVTVVLFIVGGAAAASADGKSGGDQGSNGQCPSGYTKIDHSGTKSWTAADDYASVILVGGVPDNAASDPKQERDLEFTDVSSGQTISRSHYDISHVCVKPAPPKPTEIEVGPPLYTAPTCEAQGSLVYADTVHYTWRASGPESARVLTAVPVGDVVLKGQVEFGPYDLEQRSGEECEVDEDVTVNLQLTYMMDCPGDTTNTWRVRNPHTADVVVTYGDKTHVATPGDSFFETPRGTETMVITWGGGDTGIAPGQTVKAAGEDLSADDPKCAVDEDVVPVPPTVTECVADESDTSSLPITLPEVDGLTYEVVDVDVEENVITVLVTADEDLVIADREGYVLNEDGTATFVVTYEECDVLGEVIEYEYTLDCDYLLTGDKVTYVDGEEVEREAIEPRTIDAAEAAQLGVSLPDDCDVPVFGPIVTIMEPVCIAEGEESAEVDVVLDNADSTVPVWFAVWVDGEPVADMELDAGEADGLQLVFDKAGSYEVVVEAIGDEIEDVDTYAVFETVVVVDCVDEGVVVKPDVVTPVVKPVVVAPVVTNPTPTVRPTLAATGVDGVAPSLVVAALLVGLGGLAIRRSRSLLTGDDATEV